VSKARAIRNLTVHFDALGVITQACALDRPGMDP
jgi:hypothetical protein